MSKATIAERAKEMICPECGAPVERRSKHGPKPVFCSPEHRREFANRAMVNGAAIIAYVKAWRIDRGSGEIATGSLERICQIVDAMAQEDSRAGRPRADLYAAKLLASPVPPVHELRYGRRKRAQALARRAYDEAQSAKGE